MGAICYEMLIGRAAFDAEDMDDLVHKIEAGKYKVPSNLSREVVGFLNGMLQYNAKSRLDIYLRYKSISCPRFYYEKCKRISSY